MDSGEVNTGAERQADFEASEFSRILRILLDDRIENAREMLSCPLNRKKLGITILDPWDIYNVKLFNDIKYRSAPVDGLAGAVTRSYIALLTQATTRTY